MTHTHQFHAPLPVVRWTFATQARASVGLGMYSPPKEP